MDAGLDLAWNNVDVVDPIGVAMTALMSIGILVLPRGQAVLPFAVLICFMAPGQRITIVGADFTPLRILTAVGLLRAFASGEVRRFRLLDQDVVLSAGVVAGSVAYVALRGEADAIVNRLGHCLDVLGVYFLFRLMLRGAQDVRRWLLTLAMLSIACAAAMLIEARSGRNLFAFLGGVPELTDIREGRLRCQAAFPHSILAGAFWAALLPTFIAGAVRGKQRVLWGTACLASVGCVFLAASSTPAVAVLLGVAGMCMFPFRRWLPIAGWLLLLSVFLLHLLMEHGALHLVARIDLAGGSTGWHRYFLMQSAVDRIGEWWMLGTTSTSHWGRGLGDVTSQYVLEGVRGGCIAMAALVISIMLAVRSCVRFCRVWEGSEYWALLGYALGVSIVLHAIMFIGVSYFGQLTQAWAITLALATALEAHARWPKCVGVEGASGRP